MRIFCMKSDGSWKWGDGSEEVAVRCTSTPLRDQAESKRSAGKIWVIEKMQGSQQLKNKTYPQYLIL